MKALLLLLAFAASACTTPNERRVAELDKLHAEGHLPTKYWLTRRDVLIAQDAAYSEQRALRFQNAMSNIGSGGDYRTYLPRSYPGYYGSTSWAPPGTYFNPIAVKIQRY